jgi:peptide/nickel transport system permease protein
LAVVTLFAVSLIIFVLSRAAGDPVSLMLDEYSTQEDIDRLMAKLGTDKPYYQQYFFFLRDALQGDLGDSIHRKRPVTHIIMGSLPWTLYLGLTSFIVSLLVGIPLGILSSVKRGSLIDQVAKVVALVGQAAPPFWLGIMLIIFFAVALRVFPTSGREHWNSIFLPAITLGWYYAAANLRLVRSAMLDVLDSEYIKLAREHWNSIFLPAITLGWYYAAANLRLVRSAMLDVLDSEYIKLARAKGVPYWGIVMRHAFRNALIPPLTFAGVTLGALVTGSLVVETVFAWPGLGKLAIDSLNGLDYPLLQGVVIFFTLLYVLVAFLVDVLYAYIDPRIRYA